MGLRKATEGKASARVTMQGWGSGWEQRQGLQLILQLLAGPSTGKPQEISDRKGGQRVVCTSPGNAAATGHLVLKSMKIGAHS